MLIRPLTSPRATRRAAFTLLEVLIVVAILVVLAGTSSLYVFKYLENSKVNRAKVDVKTIQTAAEAYKVQTGELPESLQQLVSPPDGGKPYIEQQYIMDPWGKPYSYESSGQHSNGTHPDVWTTTPDGQQVGNW
jgi:general secretion pathway protein G